jgi:hypothetical protein
MRRVLKVMDPLHAGDLVAGLLLRVTGRDFFGRSIAASLTAGVFCLILSYLL